MIKRIIAIVLIAGIGVNAKIGTVVAMDTTEGFSVWDSYEEYDPSSENKDALVINNEKVGDPIENMVKGLDVQMNEDTNDGGITSEIETQGPVIVPDLTDQPKPNTDLDNVFNSQNDFNDKVDNTYLPPKDNVYNQDFDFSDFEFDYAPYNPGSFDFYSPSGSIENVANEPQEVKEPGSTFKKADKTIQYFFGEAEKYQKFTDTGIKVFANGDVEYDAAVGLLERISIERKVKVVKSETKAMLLFDGKLVVIEKDNMNLNSMIEAFKGTSLNIVVQNSRSGGKYNIADYLEFTGTLPVKINGVDIVLLASPKLVNSKALLPIRSIGEGLGAEVLWDQKNKKATVKRDDIKIVFTMDKDIVDVNGTTYLITEKTFLDNDEYRLLSVIRLIVKELNASMHWDSSQNVLIIENNEAPEKVNLDANF